MAGVESPLQGHMNNLLPVASKNIRTACFFQGFINARKKIENERKRNVVTLWWSHRKRHQRTVIFRILLVKPRGQWWTTRLLDETSCAHWILICMSITWGLEFTLMDVDSKWEQTAESEFTVPPRNSSATHTTKKWQKACEQTTPWRCFNVRLVLFSPWMRHISTLALQEDLPSPLENGIQNAILFWSSLIRQFCLSRQGWPIRELRLARDWSILPSKTELTIQEHGIVFRIPWYGIGPLE